MWTSWASALPALRSRQPRFGHRHSLADRLLPCRRAQAHQEGHGQCRSSGGRKRWHGHANADERSGGEEDGTRPQGSADPDKGRQGEQENEVVIPERGGEKQAGQNGARYRRRPAVHGPREAERYEQEADRRRERPKAGGVDGGGNKKTPL